MGQDTPHFIPRSVGQKTASVYLLQEINGEEWPTNQEGDGERVSR